MRIVTLVDNKSISDAYDAEHGLSLYIETIEHKILFDLGQGQLFESNAQKMGIDLSAVDLVVISHGHYDHGGGLKKFLEINDQAKILIAKSAFEPHYSLKHNGELKNIGLDQSLMTDSRIVFIDGDCQYDESLRLCANIKGNALPLEGNHKMKAYKQGEIICDDFNHEQSLLIEENDKRVLIVGCAHRGIVNILDHVKAQGQWPIQTVIGGFHLFRPQDNSYESSDLINQMALRLIETDAMYFTGHCTGMGAFETLRGQMKDRIAYLAAGSVLEV